MLGILDPDCRASPSGEAEIYTRAGGLGFVQLSPVECQRIVSMPSVGFARQGIERQPSCAALGPEQVVGLAEFSLKRGSSHTEIIRLLFTYGESPG